MASAKKNLKKPKPVPAAAPPTPTATPGTIASAPRTLFYVAGKPFYADKAASALLITIEAATSGMDRKELNDWVFRHGVRIEVWAAAEGNMKLVLADGTQVLGDWI